MASGFDQDALNREVQDDVSERIPIDLHITLEHIEAAAWQKKRIKCALIPFT